MTPFFPSLHCLKKHLSFYAPLRPRKALTQLQFFTLVSLTSRPLSSFSTEVANPEECSQLLRRIASTPSLPPQYWLTLHCLLRHFARVCQNSSKNLLSARSLGEIFSPVFFRQQATRWVSDQRDRASLPHTQTVKDRHSARSRQDKCAASVVQHRDTQTLNHAHLQTFRQAHTLTHTLSGSHGFQLYTDIGWSFSTYQLCCAIKVAKPDLPSD